jgi:O-antigen/teichoic acid export membrane protein
MDTIQNNTTMTTLLKSKGFMALADQAVFSGTNFIITFTLAHQLIATEFGVYAGIVLVAYLFISAMNALVIQPFQVMQASVEKKEVYLGFNFVLTISLLVVISAVASMSFALDLVRPLKYCTTPSLILFGVGILMHDFLRKAMLALDRPGKALLIDAIVATVLICLILNAIATKTIGLQNVIHMSFYAYASGSIAAVILLRPSIAPTEEWRTWLAQHYSQGKWLLLSSVTQWWASNIFFVLSGIFLGPVALGAFRLSQSIFGIFNLVFQSYENYVVPRASEIYRLSVGDAQKYLRKIGMRGTLGIGGLLIILFVFAELFLGLAGGPQYKEYGFVVRGMAVLYGVTLIGYPIRIAIRMLIMNKVYFFGYVISLIISLCTARFLLSHYGLWGAIFGLLTNQLALLIVWQYFLAKKQFVLWK